MSTHVNTETTTAGRSGEPSRSHSAAAADPGMPPPTWIGALGPSGIGRVLVLFALVVWLYFDHLRQFVVIWQQPDWSHGFLIPFFSLYLIHTRRSALLSGERDGSYWGLVLILGSIGVYAGSIYLQIGYPQRLSILATTAGIVLCLGGWRRFWLTLFPIAFLFLAIPPPVRLYRQVTQPLQQFAAKISTAVLGVLPGALDVERAGINIAFFMRDGREGVFTVAGACSGMRSLMAFIALGLAVAYATERPTWHRVALAILVVPVAVACNILRVIITGSFQMYGLNDLAAGGPHMILGLLMFALGLFVFLGILWVLDHLFVESEPVGLPDGEA